MTTKGPNALDRLVGSRVRQRRLQLGISQNQLARALAVTGTESQAYEAGQSRIGASRLHQIAQALDTEVPFFF